jgi:hypothetical protein
MMVGLEPTKTGFADQRLDHFGITIKKFVRLFKHAGKGKNPR